MKIQNSFLQRARRHFIQVPQGRRYDDSGDRKHHGACCSALSRRVLDWDPYQ